MESCVHLSIAYIPGGLNLPNLGNGKTQLTTSGGLWAGQPSNGFRLGKTTYNIEEVPGVSVVTPNARRTAARARARKRLSSRGLGEGSDLFTDSGTSTFQIEDTARKNLAWLKKGINFWVGVTAIRSKHRGN